MNLIMKILILKNLRMTIILVAVLSQLKIAGQAIKREVLSTGGNFSSRLQFTIGQAASGSYAGNTQNYVLGYQQPLSVTAAETKEKVDQWNISLYPNPLARGQVL